MPSVDDCVEHGQQEIRGRAQVGDVQHVTLACGCTLEAVNSTLRERDIVLYGNVLFRVERLSEDGTAVIENNHGIKIVDVLAFDRIAADTISGLRPFGGIAVSVGDWVQHRELKIRAKVQQLRRDGKIKAEACDPLTYNFVRYVWATIDIVCSEPDAVYLAHKEENKSTSPRPRGRPGPASYDWGGDEYQRLTGGRPRPTLRQEWDKLTHRPSEKLEPKKRPGSDVSMGGLIKDEVRKFESEDVDETPAVRQRIPARKATHFSPVEPKKQTTADALKIEGPVSKRKGTW